MAIPENPVVENENLNVVGVIIISDSDSSDTEDMDYVPGPAGQIGDVVVVNEQIDDVVDTMADVIIVSDSDSDSEDDRASVIVVSDSDEDSGVELSGQVFGEGTDPIPSRMLFYNSHSLIMLTHDRICAGVDDGFHLAVINGGGMEVTVQHVTNSCRSMSLCC